MTENMDWTRIRSGNLLQRVKFSYYFKEQISRIKTNPALLNISLVNKTASVRAFRAIKRWAVSDKRWKSKHGIRASVKLFWISWLESIMNSILIWLIETSGKKIMTFWKKLKKLNLRLSLLNQYEQIQKNRTIQLSEIAQLQWWTLFGLR